MYSRQDLQFLHLLLRVLSERLSARLYNELDIKLKLAMYFILHEIVLLFSSFYLLILKKLYAFLCFPTDIQIVHQIILLAL